MGRGILLLAASPGGAGPDDEADLGVGEDEKKRWNDVDGRRHPRYIQPQSPVWLHETKYI